MSCRKLTCRNGSRVDGSDRWTSTNGRCTASSASRSATLVWVRPPALTIATSKSRRCSRSMSAPRGSTGRSRRRGRASRPLREPGVDLVERLVAVDLRLARPEQVQVRPWRTSTRVTPPASAVHGDPRHHRSSTTVPPAAGHVVADHDPVVGRQDPAQRAGRVLLVGRQRGSSTRARGRSAARRPGRAVEQPLDPPARAGGVTPSRTPIRQPPAGRTRLPRRGAGRRTRPPPRPRARPSDRG